MSQIEQIKAEIERLENYTVTSEQMADELLSFIESLEKEQDVDLTKEIARFALNGGTGDNTPTIGEIARHFYELGLNARK